MSTFGLISEMRGPTKAITEHPVPPAAADLVTAVGPMSRRDALTDESQAPLKTKQNRTQNEQLLHQLTLILRRSITDVEERDAFKGWAADRPGDRRGRARRWHPGDGRSGSPGRELDAMVVLRRELGLR
jgi:hypothetical protein